MKHLPYGGSTATRTLGCPGWIKQSEGVPKRPAGPAAIEGSMHHAVQEVCQRDGKTPNRLLGYIYEEGETKLEFTEDDLDLSEIAFTTMNTLLDGLDIDVMIVEPFVEMVKDRVGGSIDLLGLSADEKTLLIADYKFGQVKVSVKKSAQLFLYAVSARHDPSTADLFKKVTKIVFAIIQPRVKGVISTWTCTPKMLDAFEFKFARAMDSDKVHPGSHCKYCPAEPFCDIKRADVVASSALGARIKGELQSAADVVVEIEEWVNNIKAAMYFQMTKGASLKGWKIIDKRTTRKWIDEKKAHGALIAAGVPDKDLIKIVMLTAPQTEKVLKKLKVEFDLSKFIKSESSGTTLAPEDHPSEAVIASDVQGHLSDMMK